MKMPKVSVCIPTYNTARYLGQTIESVLQQGYQDYELVICDNASTDETPELVCRYEDSRIRYIRFEELTNQAGNFNRCLQAARGEYIALLHSDDYFLPGFLGDRISKLTQYPDISFVFGAVRVVDAVGFEVSVNCQWPNDRLLAENDLLACLLRGVVVSPPSMMVRRSFADRAGAFRTDLTWGHDWEWTMRLAEQGGACYVAKPLAAYRIHEGSGTAEVLNAAKNGAQERRILIETFGRLAQESRKFQHLRRPAFQSLSRKHMYFAEQALLAARRQVARYNLWYATKSDVLMLLRPSFWALLGGSFTSLRWYEQYRTLRNSLALLGSHE